MIPSPDIKRVLRRHADLLDFLTRAAFAAPRWLPDAERRVQLQNQATEDRARAAPLGRARLAA